MTDQVGDIEGRWEGRWLDNRGHGGALFCTVTKLSGDAWKAAFRAECGSMHEYTLELDGHVARQSVLFGGAVDLGQAGGGVFHWKGAADVLAFNGSYEGGGNAGNFKMTRVQI